MGDHFTRAEKLVRQSMQMLRLVWEESPIVHVSGYSFVVPRNPTARSNVK